MGLRIALPDPDENVDHLFFVDPENEESLVDFFVFGPRDIQRAGRRYRDGGSRCRDVHAGGTRRFDRGGEDPSRRR